MKKVSKSDKDFFVLILPFTERRTAEDKKQPKSVAKKKLRIFNILKNVHTQKKKSKEFYCMMTKLENIFMRF